MLTIYIIGFILTYLAVALYLRNQIEVGMLRTLFLAAVWPVTIFATIWIAILYYVHDDKL